MAATAGAQNPGDAWSTLSYVFGLHEVALHTQVGGTAPKLTARLKAPAKGRAQAVNAIVAT